MQRALVRLALLVRAVPLLQAVATLALGFAVYRRPWLGVAAACAALAWSCWLALRVWPTGRPSGLTCLIDVTVGVAALLTVGAAMPAQSLTTSFYWAVSYAAAVAFMLGLSLPPRAGYGLVVLVGTYGRVVDLGAGAQALPAAAGNAAGIAVYFGSGILLANYVKRLTALVERAEDDALRREAGLGVRQARLDEFGRLHDEAVQVLERVAAAGEQDAAELRAYAASAAGHLRGAIEDGGPAPGSVADVLDGVARGFAAPRFSVTVDCAMPLADPGGRALRNLAAAVTEALNNAAKHSGAPAASVRAVPAGHGIEVVVQDSGTGFDPGSVPAGFGITNCIRRRLEEAGGEAEFRSAPGAGTVVRMWLPC